MNVAMNVAVNVTRNGPPNRPGGELLSPGDPSRVQVCKRSVPGHVRGMLADGRAGRRDSSG